MDEFTDIFYSSFTIAPVEAIAKWEWHWLTVEKWLEQSNGRVFNEAMIPIFANAGVPMLFLHMPAILVALLPIIAIEMYVARCLLGKTMKKSIWPLTAANVASMLLGFPLLWILLVLFQMLVGGGSGYGLRSWWQKLYAVTVQAPWLIPYEGDLFWMIPVAGLVMLIPAFFLSVWLERVVLQRFWKENAEDDLRRFSFRAHLASYLVLILLWLGYGVYSFAEHKPDAPSKPTQGSVTLLE